MEIHSTVKQAWAPSGKKAPLWRKTWAGNCGPQMICDSFFPFSVIPLAFPELVQVVPRLVSAQGTLHILILFKIHLAVQTSVKQPEVLFFVVVVLHSQLVDTGLFCQRLRVFVLTFSFQGPSLLYQTTACLLQLPSSKPFGYKWEISREFFSYFLF